MGIHVHYIIYVSPGLLFMFWVNMLVSATLFVHLYMMLKGWEMGLHGDKAGFPLIH